MIIKPTPKTNGKPIVECRCESCNYNFQIYGERLHIDRIQCGCGEILLKVVKITNE